MKKSVIGIALLFTAMSFSPAHAQNDSINEDVCPLHFEFGPGVGIHLKKNGFALAECAFDLSYYIKRFSLQAICQADWFIPKDGNTVNYNYALNLGGGVGYIIRPATSTKSSIFEARAFVTTTVDSYDFKNTSYNVGIYYFDNNPKKSVSPFVGVGYTLKDFSDDSISTLHGIYCIIGLRI